MIEWKDDYRIGDAVIDAQHETWFANINGFLSAKTHAELALAEMKMYRYTRQHFKYEETAMKRTGYPYLAEHIAKHNEMLGQLNTLAYRIADGDLDLAEWRSFLTDWLLDHIAKEDTKLAKYLRVRDTENCD